MCLKKKTTDVNINHNLSKKKSIGIDILEFVVQLLFAAAGVCLSIWGIDGKTYETIMLGIAGFLLPYPVINIINTHIRESIDERLNKMDNLLESQFKMIGENGINSIGVLIQHLSKEFHCKRECKGCKISDAKSCLIEKYLALDCETLSTAIEKKACGTYSLNSNIERYHTLAIKQMFDWKCEDYSVIHYIGSNIDGRDEEEDYDSLDYHFLYNLVSEIIMRKKENAKFQFKIRWLLVGDIDNIKNRYDYIFFTLDRLKADLTLAKLKVDDFFDFYSMDEIDFKTKCVGYAGINSVINKESPNIGIFGDKFIFVESLDPNQHGDIKMNIPGFSVKEIYNEFIRLCSSKQEFNYLKEKYDDIIKDSSHKDRLEERCGIKKHL